MAINLKPLHWDWPGVTKGDTYPAINITESSSDTALSRIRVKIKLADTATAALTLDSDGSGVTLNGTGAAAWDFTIGPISATDTASLTAGTYSYDIESTDAGGVVRTEFKGSWVVWPQITD